MTCLPGKLLECTNRLDDGLFNRCYRDSSLGLWYLLAMWTEEIFHHPTIFTEYLIFGVLIAPLLMLDPTKKWNFGVPLVKKYESVKFRLANLIHQMGFVFVLGNALKTIFRQYRPCICDGKELGDMYGMPSQDAMMGGIIAAWVWDLYNNAWKWRKRGLGLLFMVLVYYQRPAVGMHTVGQVTVGTILGWMIHYYTTRIPQYMVFVNDLIQILFGIMFPLLDPALRNNAKEGYMGFTWVGISFILFADILIYRHHMGSMTSLKQSYHRILSDEVDGHAYEEVANNDDVIDVIDEHLRDDKGNMKRWSRIVDLRGIGIAFLAFILCRLFATILRGYW